MYNDNPFWKFKQKMNEVWGGYDPSVLNRGSKNIGGPPTEPPDEPTGPSRKEREQAYLKTARQEAEESHSKVAELKIPGVNLEASKRAIGITNPSEAKNFNFDEIARGDEHPHVKSHLENIDNLHRALTGVFPKKIYDSDQY